MKNYADQGSRIKGGFYISAYYFSPATFTNWKGEFANGLINSSYTAVQAI